MSARDALKALIIAAKSPAQIEQLASDLADLATELRERAAAQRPAQPATGQRGSRPDDRSGHEGRRGIVRRLSAGRGGWGVRG